MTEIEKGVTFYAKEVYSRISDRRISEEEFDFAESYHQWSLGLSSSNTVSPVDNIVESEEKWIKFHKQRVMFGYEDHMKEGIVEGYHPLWGMVIFVPSNVLVPYHYVREELIEWPKEQTKEVSNG